ncbi:phage integrase family protein [Cupriavidus oxalaticus]|jgi:hypothetical protein|uniref:phage integrase family protein n=1 Tax=Cupriavidus oxalaticus TaxID=96344 RepID=UPI0040343D8B
MVRRVPTQLHSELATAAARAGRPGTTRLLRLDLRPGASHPALAPPPRCSDGDNLAASHTAPEGSTGTASREARREPLLARQLAALDWLEGLCAHPVLTGATCSVWLPETQVTRLADAGVTTLGQLIDRINDLGDGWTGPSPGSAPERRGRSRPSSRRMPRHWASKSARASPWRAGSATPRHSTTWSRRRPRWSRSTS